HLLREGEGALQEARTPRNTSSSLSGHPISLRGTLPRMPVDHRPSSSPLRSYGRRRERHPVRRFIPGGEGIRHDAACLLVLAAARESLFRIVDESPRVVPVAGP